ncbi:RimK family alpha-L-glutamate ligase [Pendulispora albinea]|uniref:ATP-grasp domain-containing protein n=1 Tax=Pendulispora albinea TaxID=2741071 RepID=A0ABZ2M903_9BACT
MDRAIRRVGLLVGRERSFPEALMAEVAKRNLGVEVVYARFDAPRATVSPEYEVLVDRISHEVPCYQPFLKAAKLRGVRTINDPFFRIADDKFFDVALASTLGVAAPKTVLLPSKDYESDIDSESLRHNMALVDWGAIEGELGFPMYIKPHWGGGWRAVRRVTSMAELHSAYDHSGRFTMILQEEIVWTQYVRCIVIGGKSVLPALWDPRLSHFERYRHAHRSMPALEPQLEQRVVHDALKLTRALGYDMNTVEFAIADGVPYAIDFMNSAPDFDITSLGESHFQWTVEKMADLVIEAARTPRAMRPRWHELLPI